MLGWIIFAASAYSAFIFGNWFVIGNAVLNFWSLGIMTNYGTSSHVTSGAESFWITVNMITAVFGLLFFGITFLQ